MTNLLTAPLPHVRACAAIVVLVAAGLGSGCTTFTPSAAREPGIELPQSFSMTAEEPAIRTPERWWMAFGDPELDGVVETALADNLSLRMAWDRLEQMRAAARISGAARWPSVDLAVSGERQHLGGQPAPPLGPEETTTDTVTATLSVGYQADLWRKIGNAHRAELLGAAAGRRDTEATAQAICAAAVQLWYSIAAQQATVELLGEQIEVGQEYLDLVKIRFANGLASAMDVYRQELQVESTRSQLPAAETRLATLEHQLALLLGRPPQAELPRPAAALPVLPSLPAAGVPATVLRARPDVAAAELRLAAADHRLAAAVADRYPTLRFTATAGSQAGSFSELLDTWWVNLAGNLLAPLFDGGRRKAEADRNRALVRESLHAWQSTLLSACHEVEDALVQERGLLAGQTVLDRQLELARKTLDRSRARYLNGLTDYLNVLTSLQSLQNLERAEIDTREELLVNRVTLHLALGGTWSAELSPATEVSS